MADLDDVVSSLERVVFSLQSIENEISYWKKDTTASKILEALREISSSISAVESRLQNVEQTIREH